MVSDDLFGTDSESGNDTDDLIESAKKQPASKETGDGSQKKKRLGAARKIATKRLEKTNTAATKKKDDIPGKFCCIILLLVEIPLMALLGFHKLFSNIYWFSNNDKNRC